MTMKRRFSNLARCFSLDTYTQQNYPSRTQF